MKVFIDTCIPIYAAGGEHPLKAGCVDILASAAEGKLDAYTDSEVFQEILYRYFIINRRNTGLEVFDLFSRIMFGAVLPVRYRDVVLARKLVDEIKEVNLAPRDLVHLAVMRNNGIQGIITADQDIAKVAGIQVITPN